ncbi:MAG: L-threonylcarbamoyladenylate synthase [Bacteroidota bacterium]
MYKVFIENREVNFTNKFDSLNGKSFIDYSSIRSLINEFIPLIINRKETEQIYVYLNEEELDFNEIFREFKYVEAAGGIVQFKEDFLFIKRNGFWDIPKGKLDPNESFEIAAAREIQEECGLVDLIRNELICATYHTYYFKDKWHLKKTNWYHFSTNIQQEVKCQVEEGITDAIWLPKSKFPEILENTFLSIKYVIQKFIKLRNEDIELEKAISFLNEGKVVAIPTETVYGLAANVFSSNAIDQVFALKNRPQTNPLIVHCASLERVFEVVNEIPEKGLKLAKQFWPGPLTLLLPKKELIPSKVTAGSNRVGVRVPNHRLALKLLQNLDFPLAAPSANKYGSISPTCTEHVTLQFGNEIPFILDGGPCEVGIESTIIGFDGDKTIIYRLGKITLEDIVDVCGNEVYIENEAGELIVAPGMVKHHYAPKTKLIIVSDFSEIQFSSKNGLILFNNEKLKGIPSENQVILSKDENFEEASRNLYRAFYELDQLHLDKIYIKQLPDIGIGKSINDRIRRAGLKED